MCNEGELKNITDNITKASKDIFSERLNKVILYGSYARGENSEYSDIDIMIIVDMPANDLLPFRKMIDQIASDLSLETDDCVTVSATLQDNETFSRYKEVLPYYRNVLSDGVVLYAA